MKTQAETVTKLLTISKGKNQAKIKGRTKDNRICE
jgi:hypothetical protein